MDTLELIKNYLVENGYKIEEMDDNSISVRYQMNIVHIFPNKEDKEFVSILLSGFEKVNDENTYTALALCMGISNTQKVTKAYIMNDSILIAYEFNFLGEDNLYFQIKTGLDAVVAAKGQYRNLKDRFNSEQ